MSKTTNKEKILEAGLALIYKRGYNASGIQDIANEAKVPKGSFYNYFKSKEIFTTEVIKEYARVTLQFLKSRLSTGKGKALARLKKMLNYWADTMYSDYDGCGCLVGNLSQEMSNQSQEIRAALSENFEELEACFIKCIEEAKQQGELPQSTQSPKRIGRFIYNGWQGALIRAKAEGNNKQLKEYIDFIFKEVLN